MGHWIERERPDGWSLSECPVEFIEQPMAKGMEQEMSAIARDFPVKLALDESICFLDDLKALGDSQWEESMSSNHRSRAVARLYWTSWKSYLRTQLSFLALLNRWLELLRLSAWPSNLMLQVRALRFRAEDLFLKDGVAAIGAFFAAGWFGIDGGF